MLLRTCVRAVHLSCYNRLSFAIVRSQHTRHYEETAKTPVTRNPGHFHSGTDETSESLINFQDYKNAFKFHSLGKLAKSLLVFRLCSYEAFANNSLKLMNIGKRALGRRLFTSLMKRSFYSHFVGGENEQELKHVIDDMEKRGIGPILLVPMEEDTDTTSSPDQTYDENMKVVLDCVSLCRQIHQERPMIQIKMTAFLPPTLCVKISDNVPDPNKSAYIVQHLSEVFRNDIPVNLTFLDSYETECLQKGIRRLRCVGELAVEKDVRLMVDAEYTYLNPALNLLSLAMMLTYNEEAPIVSYTYQAYLKSTFERLKGDVAFIRSRDVMFGAKQVRGAYIDKERRIAKEQGYSDPVHPTFEDTTKMYHQCADFLLEHAKRYPNKSFVLLGTHNENTLQHIVHEMQTRNVNKDLVYFGQVYGMGDYLTLHLAQAGYQAYKSIPYGSVEETLPYLYRRAMENKSLLGGTQKERVLLWKAFLSRVTRGALPRA